MSTALVETLKEQFIQLTETERAELFQFMAEHLKDHPQTTSPPSEKDVVEAELRRRQHLEWLKTHREQYGGQYVALDGDRLVATGRNFPETATAAKRAGVPNAFVSFVYPLDYVGYTGGW